MRDETDGRDVLLHVGFQRGVDIALLVHLHIAQTFALKLLFQILGEDELQGQTIAIKPLRTDEPQQTVAWDALSETLQVFFNQDSSLTN